MCDAVKLECTAISYRIQSTLSIVQNILIIKYSSHIFHFFFPCDVQQTQSSSIQFNLHDCNWINNSVIITYLEPHEISYYLIITITFNEIIIINNNTIQYTRF